MKRLAILVIVLSAIAQATRAEETEVWSSVWHSHLISPADRTRFGLLGVRARGNRLTGWAEFENYVKGNPNPPIAVIPGRKAAGGVFWPSAILQVSDGEDGPWETIGRSPRRGIPATISVAAGATNSDLHVDLSAFRSVRRAKQWGRILLGTGDAAIFEMRMLLPPAEQKP